VSQRLRQPPKTLTNELDRARAKVVVLERPRATIDGYLKAGKLSRAGHALSS